MFHLRRPVVIPAATGHLLLLKNVSEVIRYPNHFSVHPRVRLHYYGHHILEATPMARSTSVAFLHRILVSISESIHALTQACRLLGVCVTAVYSVKLEKHEDWVLLR